VRSRRGALFNSAFFLPISRQRFDSLRRHPKRRDNASIAYFMLSLT
jgi:hypothetical protein